MTPPLPRPVVPVPTLDALATDLGLADGLPLPALADLARRAERLAADLRLAVIVRASQGRVEPEAERVVLIEEAARMLATSEDTLYTKWNKLPFAFKDPLDGKIKFRLSGIERYIASRVGRAG